MPSLPKCVKCYRIRGHFNNHQGSTKYKTVYIKSPKQNITGMPIYMLTPINQVPALGNAAMKEL